MSVGRDERGPWVEIEPAPGQRFRIQADMLRELCHAWLVQCDYAELECGDEPERIEPSGMEPEDIRW